jgi:hypothetical protein
MFETRSLPHMSTISLDYFHANAALPQGVNPLPYFRERDHDVPVRVKPDVPLKYQRLMGLDCGRRMLPYRMQDRYDRNRQEQDIPAIIMENEFLKATFLHTLGGRLISLVDKENDKELLHCNRSLQVGNLATLDAWFAGGIEWNFGQYGHAFTTSSKLFASIQKDTEGEDFLRLYDFEPCKALWWHIDFHLPKDSRQLYAHVGVYNLEDTRTSLYYWTNTAVEMSDDTRILASSDKAVYLDPFASKGTRLFGYMQMPNIDTCKNIDASYPNRFDASNEYFFTCENESMPWECALGGDGTGFYEVSTPLLGYRKMFCWGSHAGGKRWQRYLAPDSNSEYVEIQSGLACSQLHGYFIEGNSSLSWTQAFGPLAANSHEVHDVSYALASEAAKRAITNQIDTTKLTSMHERFSLESQIEPGEIMQRSTGWGFLQKKLKEYSLPGPFVFDEGSVRDEEKPYLSFLEEGKLPVMDLTRLPLTPPICSEAWKERFLVALQNPDLTDTEEATLKHYLGIIHLELEEISCALTLWLECMAVMPNAWTARNLAVLEERRGCLSDSLQWYALASTLPGFAMDPCIAEEYCKLLVDNKMVEQARLIFDALPQSWIETSEKLSVPRARLAAMQGDAALIKALVLDKELGHIREGDAPLNDLWLAYNMIIYTNEQKVEATEEVIERVKKLYPIPAKYDMNMFE